MDIHHPGVSPQGDGEKRENCRSCCAGGAGHGLCRPAPQIRCHAAQCSGAAGSPGQRCGEGYLLLHRGIPGNAAPVRGAGLCGAVGTSGAPLPGDSASGGGAPPGFKPGAAGCLFGSAAANGAAPPRRGAAVWHHRLRQNLCLYPADSALPGRGKNRPAAGAGNRVDPAAIGGNGCLVWKPGGNSPQQLGDGRTL